MKSRVQSTYIFWKKCSILRKKTFFNFFWPNFYKIYFSKPLCYFKWNPLIHSKLKTTKVHGANKYFFPITGPLLAICMAGFCITEYSAFIYKKKHSLYQCLLVGDRSVSLHNGNLEFPATEKCENSKGLTTNIFANICI